MILNNGQLRFANLDYTVTYDEKGNPIQPEPEWGDLIPCMYQMNERKTAKTAENEAYTERKVTITVERMDVSERVLLYDEKGIDLGEWIVENIQDLNYIDQTRLECKPK